MSSVSEWFELTVSPWELIARGTILYLGLILTLRFVLRRDIGSLSVADLMFIVIVADAAQNALSGEYKSITEGAILVGTLVAWNVALDWLAYRSPRFRRDPRAARASPDQGWPIWSAAIFERSGSPSRSSRGNCGRSGIDDIAQVRVAYLESSGELGVIRADEAKVEQKRRRVPGAD